MRNWTICVAEAASPASSATRILVVEDDALVGLSLVGYLEELGASVTWASKLEDAINVIDCTNQIDIAIVDLNLNGVMSNPILDRLLSKRVFTLLCTGYELSSIDVRFRGLPRCEKPFTRAGIRMLLNGRL